MCLLLGMRSRAELHDLPISDYREWMDYFHRHPHHANGVEYQVAAVAWQLAAMFGGKDSTKKKPEDFLAFRFESEPVRDAKDLTAGKIDMKGVGVRVAR